MQLKQFAGFAPNLIRLGLNVTAIVREGGLRTRGEYIVGNDVVVERDHARLHGSRKQTINRPHMEWRDRVTKLIFEHGKDGILNRRPNFTELLYTVIRL